MPQFVLTRQEKQVVVFVIVAFVLGLSTKCYRDGRAKLPATPTPAKAAPGYRAASPRPRH